MAASQKREARVRFREATPKQRAAVEEIFPEELAKGRRCLGVLFGPAVAGAGTSGRAAAPRYVLRKGLGAWKLVFEGKEAVLADEKGIYYVAHLLINPPAEPMHASELASKAMGDAVIENQRNLGLDDQDTVAAQAASRREFQAVLDDDEATVVEKDEARRELGKITEWVKRHQRGTEASEQKQSRAVRAAIRRLLENLARATNEQRGPHEVLRAFGEHVERYLWKPSSWSGAGRNFRVRAKLAGRFTCEPPAGVKWSG